MSQKLDIEFSDEQAMLLDTAQQFFHDHSTFDNVRRWMHTETGYDESLWRQIKDLGWLGVAVPEYFGGSGLDLGSLVPIFEAAGEHLFASPLLATTLATQALLAAPETSQSQAWLPALASGKTLGTVAVFEPHGCWDLSNVSCTAEKSGNKLVLNGIKTGVLDAHVADCFIISAQLDQSPILLLAPRAAIPEQAMQRELIVDETHRSFRLNLTDVELPESAILIQQHTDKTLEHIAAAANLLLAADMTGGANGVMKLTLEYLRTRTQFGKLIGSYQALKHPMVDIMCEVEFSRSQIYYAATLFQSGEIASLDDVIGTAVRMAKVQSGTTYAHAADRAIQFHGGIGFTYECPAQLFLRRARWAHFLFGDALHHRNSLANALL